MASSLPDKYEPRCVLCNHSKKKQIERMLVSGWSYSDIEQEFANTEPAPRRSISNHAKHHMDYEDQAIRRLIERQAEERGLNVETATQRLIQNKTYLQLTVDKGFQALVDGNVSPDQKDVLRAIELLDKLEKDGIGWAIDKIESQYKALAQAVKEIVPASLMPAIIARARNIYETGTITVEATDSSNGEGTLALSESREVSANGSEPGVSDSMAS